MPNSSASPSDEERSKLLSEAIRLAMEVSSEGVSNLSEFLGAITGNVTKIAETADEKLTGIPQDSRDRLAEIGGQWANDAMSVVLDGALKASEQLDNNPPQRERNLNALSQLVSTFGSVFIDTANKAVGTAAAQPATLRPRQVTVEVERGKTEKQSAWIVNRGASIVTDAPVRVLVDDEADEAVKIESSPGSVSVGPRGRCRVTLTVTAHEIPHGSFTDALLLVEGVGSIVVRAIVKAPAETPPTSR
jgi:hypothetical protein